MTEIGSSLRFLVRRHERRILGGYLAILALVAIAVILPQSRLAVLTGIDAGIRWWDGRWARRLAGGERLLGAGRNEEATAFLARLDRLHPATSVRHARDKERERLLLLLARGYEATGKRGLAIETYWRLIAFDSLNYRNHFELARAAERLLSGWALAPEARDGYAAALRLLPAHLPSVRGYIDYYLDRGEFPPVVEAYRAYLDAHLVQDVQVGIGDTILSLPALVDGRPHDYQLWLAKPAAGGELAIATDGFAFALERVEVAPALRVGRTNGASWVVVPMVNPTLHRVESLEGARYRALDSTAAVRLALPRELRDLVGIRIRLALFKPIDAGLWVAVARSYRNLLDQAGLAEASRRTVTVGGAEAADRVLSHLAWARAGLELKPNERPF